MKSSAQSVLSVVLESDVERTELLKRFQVVSAQQEKLSERTDTPPGEMEALLEELTELQERMEHIGVDSAEVQYSAVQCGFFHSML